MACSPQSASGPDAFVDTRTFSKNHPRLGRCRSTVPSFVYMQAYIPGSCWNAIGQSHAALRFLTNQRHPLSVVYPIGAKVRSLFGKCHKIFVFGGQAESVFQQIHVVKSLHLKKNDQIFFLKQSSCKNVSSKIMNMFSNRKCKIALYLWSI